jgi:hypothetical protein
LIDSQISLYPQSRLLLHVEDLQPFLRSLPSPSNPVWQRHWPAEQTALGPHCFFVQRSSTTWASSGKHSMNGFPR